MQAFWIFDEVRRVYAGVKNNNKKIDKLKKFQYIPRTHDRTLNID